MNRQIFIAGKTSHVTTKRQRFPARWPVATPTEPTPRVMLTHSARAAAALADDRVAYACELLEQIPHEVPYPWVAQLVAAVVMPDRAEWNRHEGIERPVPAGMLVAVDLGEGRPLIDRAAVFDWGPGCGPAGEGRVIRWARIEGAGRPT